MAESGNPGRPGVDFPLGAQPFTSAGFRGAPLLEAREGPEASCSLGSRQPFRCREPGSNRWPASWEDLIPNCRLTWRRLWHPTKWSCCRSRKVIEFGGATRFHAGGTPPIHSRKHRAAAAREGLPRARRRVATASVEDDDNGKGQPCCYTGEHNTGLNAEDNDKSKHR